MTRKVKWGVIGSGGIARRRTIPEGILKARNAKLSLVFDVDERSSAEVAKESRAREVQSVEALLGGDVDAVYIATPAYLHHDQVKACAAAGKHVLCEKPLGMTIREAKEMIEACKTAGVKLGCAFMMRFVAQHVEALKLIEKGKLGKPTYARAQLSCWYPPIENAWRQDLTTGGGGSLIDMGGHCIDLLEMFFGLISKVSCFTNSIVHDYESEDGATALLYFENGALGTVDTFFCIPDASSKNVLELYGSQGSILAKGTIGQGPAGDMVAHLEGRGKGYDARQARGDGRGVIIAPKPVNTYRAEIEEFSQAILDERATVIGAELGLRSQKILAACYESARSARAVEVK